MFKFIARSRLTAVLAAGVSAAAICAISAPAYAQEQTRTFDIPAQPLASALGEYSRQSGTVVVVPADLTAGKQAPAIQGTMTPEAALQRLLVGSGLEPRARSVGGLTLVASRSSPTQLGAAEAPSNEEEIVVTAQKRAENILDVPASVSVIGGEEIEQSHITQLSDLSGRVPGLQINGGGNPGNSFITLRGIAAVVAGATVGTYIDDTPLGSSTFYAKGAEYALDLFPYDLERVEVLRGPQGTLYGASTMGGLLKYVTRAPDLSTREFRLGGDVSSIADGDDLGWGARASANVPLVEDVVGLRGSYAYQRTPGYIDNVTTGAQDQNEVTQEGGRLSFLWDASENVSFRLSGTWQSLDGLGGARVDLDPTTGEALNGRLTDNNIRPEPFNSDTSFYAATLNWDLGWADFVSATSFSHATTHQVTDLSAVYGPLVEAFGGPPGSTAVLLFDVELEKYTQEFRLASPSGGRVEWLAGVFYTNEDSSNDQAVTGDDADGVSVPGVDPLVTAGLFTTYTEYAVFGDLTYRFTDQFDVTAGVRWAHNEQDFRQTSGGLLGGGPDLPGTSEEDVFTYMVSPRFHVNEDTMIYARVASGYRPGGPNPNFLGSADPAAEADTLVNYELGLKSEFLDRRVLLDLAVFQIDWNNIQTFVDIPLPVSHSIIGNAGEAESKGVELTTVFRPIDGLSLGVNAAYTEATFIDAAPLIGVAAGDPLPRIPKRSWALMADYSMALSENWTGRVGGTYRHVDERPSSVGPGVFVSDGYELLDLNADVSNDRWVLRVFVNNVADEEAYLTSGGDSLGGITGTPVQPRTIGVGLDVSF